MTGETWEGGDEAQVASRSGVREDRGGGRAQLSPTRGAEAAEYLSPGVTSAATLKNTVEKRRGTNQKQVRTGAEGRVTVTALGKKLVETEDDL